MSQGQGVGRGGAGRGDGTKGLCFNRLSFCKKSPNVFDKIVHIYSKKPSRVWAGGTMDAYICEPICVCVCVYASAVVHMHASQRACVSSLKETLKEKQCTKISLPHTPPHLSTTHTPFRRAKNGCVGLCVCVGEMGGGSERGQLYFNQRFILQWAPWQASCIVPSRAGHLGVCSSAVPVLKN